MVEYVILVTDKWQNNKLGRRLTDYCINLSKKWGLKRIFAQTTSDNHRIIAVFQKRGFSVEYDPKTATVFLEKK